MKQFERLFTRLDSTTSVNARLKALVDFFSEAPDPDKLWCIALLTGRRPKRTVSTSLLRSWAAECASIPDWLFEETYHTVGDLSETISLLVAAPATSDVRNLSHWMLALEDLAGKTEEEKRAFVVSAWNALDAPSCFIFNKLITGGWRIGVSRQMIVKSLSIFLNAEEAFVAQRLTGNWHPAETTFAGLVSGSREGDFHSKPYPFCLAHPLETDQLQQSAEVSDFLFEWKWDGIRVQLIKRKGLIYLWSRGEELIGESFPEMASLAEILPDGTVFDGELLSWNSGEPAPFSSLQKRLGRKNPSRKFTEGIPVKILVYDLLEYQGNDIRNLPLLQRRERLAELLGKVNSPLLSVSQQISVNSWESALGARAVSRMQRAEGLMIKKLDSPYVAGRKRGFWWKWKVDPFTVDAVLIYAMQGHGRRANLYTDYTFAVWHEDSLLPFTKAYSGLTDDELKEVDRFVKANTLERFGPVRSVTPELVFEIGFEGIMDSTRHKSGIALRFPRILRWRKDKPAKEADTLATLRRLLAEYGN